MNVICDKCNVQMNLNDIDLRQLIVKRNYKEYLITYYACPECDVKYMVMVQDEQSIKTKKNVDFYINKIKTYRKLGKYVSKNIIKYYENGTR